MREKKSEKEFPLHFNIYSRSCPMTITFTCKAYRYRKAFYSWFKLANMHQYDCPLVSLVPLCNTRAFAGLAELVTVW